VQTRRDPVAYNLYGKAVSNDHIIQTSANHTFNASHFSKHHVYHCHNNRMIIGDSKKTPPLYCVIVTTTTSSRDSTVKLEATSNTGSGEMRTTLPVPLGSFASCYRLDTRGVTGFIAMRCEGIEATPKRHTFPSNFCASTRDNSHFDRNMFQVSVGKTEFDKYSTSDKMRRARCQPPFFGPCDDKEVGFASQLA